MIVGTAYLANKTNPVPSKSGQVSVVAEIAQSIFGTGFLFYMVQFFTLLILVLAANTSFQGFPRLSALLARDRWIPRQFENLGDRLVYSNGMVVLSVLAVVLVMVFKADVNKLLQLYVVGVFTAFTLSQSGMVRYWLRVAKEGGRKAQGWQWRLAINAVGAVATALVLVIVVITKFVEGAWIVIASIPVMIVGFYGVHRHYDTIRRQLRRETIAVAEAPANHVLIVVDAIDDALAEAIGYVRSFAGEEFRAVHIRSPSDPPDLEERWRSFCRTTKVELELLDPRGDPVKAVIECIRAIARQASDFVTVVVPEELPRRSMVAVLRRRTSLALKFRLLVEPGVVVTDVPVLARHEDPDGGGADAGPRTPRIPRRVEAVVFVAGIHDASIRAINYARSLRATETRAVFFAFEPEEATRIQEEWERFQIPVELDIVEAPFRDLNAPILEEVRAITEQPDSLAVVVVPEFRVKAWRHQILHNQKALFIKRLLLFEDRVILCSVPYQLD
jgi:hypothetical protein